LCCGKSIHLNCLAEWLKSNSSCPQCRSNLPPLSVGQESHQRRDDRRVAYGRERISIPIRDLTIEEFILNSLSSSSSDDSPSSSSSSSSESSTFFYSGLDYGGTDIQSFTSINDDASIRNLLSTRSDTPTPFQSQPLSNYITSDEEEQHNSDSDNDDSSNGNTYQSETDEDIGRYSFHTNDSQRSLDNYESNFELARNDDIDIVSDTQSTGYGETTGDMYDLLNEDSSVDSQNASYRGNGISSREISIRTSSMNLDFAPFRMSFLDPELLGSVQNVENGRWSNGVDSRGNNGDDILEVPEFARPEFLRATDDVHPN
jgi:hypothetical protein